MIFLDSSFIIAFEVDSDTNHGKAVKLMGDVAQAAYGPAIISDYVFDGRLGFEHELGFKSHRARLEY